MVLVRMDLHKCLTPLENYNNAMYKLKFMNESERKKYMNTQSQIQKQLIARAEADEKFRAQLLENPKAAIKDETGLSVPDGINIRVVEDDASDYHLVLPPAGRNLSDQEIGGVAGGIGDIHTW